MSVVTRGVMAAGMAIYAAIHVGQAMAEDGLDPAWADAGFVLSAIVASLLAVALVATANRFVEHAAALLAIGSMAALVVTETFGLFGVAAGQMRAEVMVVVVAEVFVLVAWAIEQYAPKLGHIERSGLEDPTPSVH